MMIYGVLAFCLFGVLPANASQSAALIETRIANIEDTLKQLTGVVERIQHNFDKQLEESRKLHQDIALRLDETKASLEELKESLKKTAQTSVKKAAASTDKTADNKATLKAGQPNKPSEDSIKEVKALMAQGSYKTAQARAKQYISKFGESSSESQTLYYWLGEACYGEKSYSEASLAYVKGYKINPNSSKAPELLYKLSKTLIAMGKKKDAKVTLEKLLADYKDLSPRLRKLAEQEKSKTSRQ
ncbi:MAG: tetratricopeptide repeat protein [Holosporales bacterium]|jgi:TolA-binding protein|nr:tetratricopeptide repeat protein [Holosporales bacterium]